MAKDAKSGGFQSAAGLIRYFDSEDEKAIKISPYAVMAMAIITIAIVAIASSLWPT